MGGAILRGVIDRKVAPAASIRVNDRDKGKAGSLAAAYGCLQADMPSLVRSSDHLIIAVKPQDSEGLLREVSGYIDTQTVLSVMAGIKIDAIKDILGKDVPVARAMPNMAAVMGESMTCVSFSDRMARKNEVRDILSGIGRVMEIDEALLDAVTALSGSGPAYLFFLADAMISAGEKIGLEPGAAKELVVQTLYGASAILRNEADVSAGTLIRAVASRGGTTEAALSVFEQKGLRKIVETAVRKAKERSEELSRG